MVSLFTENTPAENSAVQSSEIRENFEALYDKVRTLEVRAEQPNTTSVLVLGGPVYFRASTSNQLRLVNFNTTVFNFLEIQGYKTKRDSETGTLFREQQGFSGPSSFESQGLFLEVLVSLQSNGRLTFTEAIAGQNNELSSPFNIYFDDSEIPIALIILEKNAEGVLQSIPQLRIREARGFVTTSYQNNQQVAAIDQQTQENTARIQIAETGLRVTDSLATRLLPQGKRIADLTTETNTKVEVLSGKFYDAVNQNYVRFAGATVDFSTLPANTSRNVDAGVGALGLSPERYNKATISLLHTGVGTGGENSELVVSHGLGGLDPAAISPPIGPADSIPLASVLYKTNSLTIVSYDSSSSLTVSGTPTIKNGSPFLITDSISNNGIYIVGSTLISGGNTQVNFSSGTLNIEAVGSSAATNEIEPLISETFLGDERIGYEFSILSLTTAPTSDPEEEFPAFISFEVNLSGTGFTEFQVESQLFAPGSPIEISDSNSRPLRRIIDSTTYDTITEIATISVTDSFVQVDATRAAKAKLPANHLDLIEDLRPFFRN